MDICRPGPDGSSVSASNAYQTGRGEFSSSARWIWAEDPNLEAWWVFRRGFVLPTDCRDGRLHITAAYHYLLCVNGKLVTRGPARSYDFHKLYDTVDVQPLLRPGEANVVAILAPSYQTQRRRGVLAELAWCDSHGHRHTLATDGNWKCRRHSAFKADTAGRALGIELLLGREEWFDARNEPLGWNTVEFDDSSWKQAVELGPANMAPWFTLEASGISLLTDDPVQPVSFAAVELARLRPGYRIRLVSPEPYINAVKLFLTEVTCDGRAAVRFHGDARILLNGTPAAPDPSSGQVSLSQGTHLLGVHQAGYYRFEMELLIETEAELSFSAKRILATDNADWALYACAEAEVAYPWHQTAADVPAPAALRRLLETARAEDIPNDLRKQLFPAAAQVGSVSMDVMTQRYYRVRGGCTDPAIETAQPRMPAPPELASPLSYAHHLLHDQPDAAVIHPTPGYDTHVVLDFGRERIGYAELTIDAPAGAVVDAQCFEKIDPTGIAWMKHNGFRYVCREGLQTFTSHFRRGFRYVSVTLRDFDRPVRFYSLRCRQSSYPVQRTGGFECSDWQLNRAYRMSVDTAAVCMLDTYVDCPGHEQNFWVGDARITALINMLAFGAFELDQRCIRLVAQSLSPQWVREYRQNDERYTSGRFVPMSAFPNYPEGGLPMWSFQWALQCWEHWLHGGNLDDLKENYGYVAEFLRHCRLLTNERNLFDMPGAWNLIEWAANDLSPHGEVTANNVLLVQCLREAAAMAETLGLAEDARSHTAEAEARCAAINRFCWNGERQAYVDTVRDEWAYECYVALCTQKGWHTLSWEQYHGCLRVSEQTNTLAVLCGCVPPKRLGAVKRIVTRVTDGRFVTSSPAGRRVGPPAEQEAPDGIVAIGSPFFLFFSLDALFQLGQDAAAIQVMRREWGKMAAMGWRTCPESFGHARSAAHAWSAAPAVYLPKHVLGVRPLEPGYRTFTVAPCRSDLQWARGSVATPYGPIHVEWQRDERNELAITCSAPPECQRA